MADLSKSCFASNSFASIAGREAFIIAAANSVKRLEVYFEAYKQCLTCWKGVVAKLATAPADCWSRAMVAKVVKDETAFSNKAVKVVRIDIWDFVNYAVLHNKQIIEASCSKVEHLRTFGIDSIDW